MTETTEKNENIFTIQSYKLDEVKEKIEKLNKKARKLGCEPTVLNEISRETRKVNIDKLTSKDVEYVTIEVIGKSPRLNGWKFIATIEPTEEEGKNLIRKVPDTGVEVPKEYRDVPTTRCDHCNTARRRNEVFVVQNEETKEFKCVGRQCIKDFLGYNASPNEILRYATDLFDLVNGIRSGDDDLLGGGGFGGRGETYVKMDEFLFRAAVLINKKGYVSWKTAQEMGYGYRTTSNETWESFFLYQNYRGQYAKEIVHDPQYGYYMNVDGTKPRDFGKNDKGSCMTDNDYRKACKLVNDAMMYAKEAIIDKNDDDLNDFEYNLKIVLQHENVPMKQKGFAAALFPVYYRHLKDGEAYERRKKATFIGSVGEKITTKLTMTNLREYEHAYGTGYIYTFTDETGVNQITWFASKRQPMEEGQTYTVTATVKTHEDSERYGRKTIITRAKILKE